jgi:hypothetical protein
MGQSIKNFGNSVGFNLSILFMMKSRKLQTTKNELALETNTAYKKQFDDNLNNKNS